MEHGAESREPREGIKDKHRTPNTERRTPNIEHRTSNVERRKRAGSGESRNQELEKLECWSAGAGKKQTK